MTDLHPLAGVYAAAVTPLKATIQHLTWKLFPYFCVFSPHADATAPCSSAPLARDHRFLPKNARHCCALRVCIVSSCQVLNYWQAQAHPAFPKSIELTKLAFDLGYDGVVVLPPYYFRKATDEGLFNWFSELITKAVPANKYLLGYHIPSAAGIGFSLDLLARLKNAFPTQFAGIKNFIS